MAQSIPQLPEHPSLKIVAWMYEGAEGALDSFIDSPPETMRLTAAKSKSVEPLVKLSDALAALAAQPLVGVIPEGAPSDVSFKIVSAWLQQEGTMANGDQLYSMCRFADFVLAQAPQPPAVQQDSEACLSKMSDFGQQNGLYPEFEKQGGWQPIETAPKDGTHILLGRFPDAHQGAMHIGLCAVDWWRQHKEAAGYVGWAKFNPSYWPPTHWMPLPPAPSIGTPTQGVDHG